ncbi:unnamed protein product [Auanema sp. JU1783]|nr:unnamed protein product [Auanema sp. JU1783]
MYGLLIEGIRFMVEENFGHEVLQKVLQRTHLTERAISTHDQYSENIIPNILNATCEVTGRSPDEVGVLAGRFFVKFLIKHGYGDLMHVMGRRFSDFLKGLDNIHEYFRFSYPKIRPPSFYCSSESEDGLILHYRSRRQGYIAYVIGQLVELARIFYQQDLGVKVLKKKEKGKFSFVIIQLFFNNGGLRLDNRLKEKVKNLNEYLPVDTVSFLKMFPFYIAFNRKLEIIMCGHGLINLMPEIPGQNMVDVFDLQKPCIKFTAEGCLAHENCNFQLESLHPVVKRTQEEIQVKINGIVEDSVELTRPNSEALEGDLPYVVLRGPIIYLKGCETFLLLATCVVDGLDAMFRMGIYLNDYGDADCNREIIMASIQKSDHLKNLLQSEKQRSQVLTEMTREIALNKKKARQLLAQMMPIEVANTMLKTGKAEACEAFESCTIAFIKIVDFSNQSHELTAVEIVNLLNSLYSLLDEIVDIHGVYKVETIGESYMISVGVPYSNDHDSEIVADCCIHMITRIRDSEFYFGDRRKKMVQVKIGAYSGACVGGIVGLRAPRYCLFGDTVNCASRMESHNKTPMTIQVGQKTKDRLEKQSPSKFKVKHRGLINVKGKGDMKAYEIVAKSGRYRYTKVPPLRPIDDDDEENELNDILDNDTHRNSAMSRMSITWGGESMDQSRVGSSISRRTSDSSTIELNNTIAQTIAQTSDCGLFEEINHPKSNTVEKRLEKTRVELAKMERYAETAKVESKLIKPNVNGIPKIAEKEKEKEEINLSLQNSVDIQDVNKKTDIGDQYSETPRPTLDEYKVLEKSKLIKDKPVEVKEKNSNGNVGRVLPEIKSKSGTVNAKELKEVKKIANNQINSMIPELKIKEVLPAINPQNGDTCDQEEHKRCKCEEIRMDPKLKTKVCSIQ